MPDNLLFIGIDAAAADVNTGLVALETDPMQIRHVAIGKEKPVDELLNLWLADHSGPVMACIDAPLGWPAAFSDILATHQAGMPITIDKGQFFPRITDKLVHQKLGKRPLEVTANYIARTAHRALQLIGVLNQSINGTFQLFLDSGKIPYYGLAETYPAGWLISEQYNHKGYKKSEAMREEILESIEQRYSLAIALAHRRRIIQWEHTFDALLCCLCGVDILQQRCLAPEDLDIPKKIAQKEGWVWFKEIESPS